MMEWLSRAREDVETSRKAETATITRAREEIEASQKAEAVAIKQVEQVRNELEVSRKAEAAAIKQAEQAQEDLAALKEEADALKQLKHVEGMLRQEVSTQKPIKQQLMLHNYSNTHTTSI